jgi:PAS domain S-box-containing protein
MRDLDQRPDAADALRQEVRRQRAGMRDLVALGSLPATWRGREPHAIGESFADAVLRALHLELIFLRLGCPPHWKEVEILRTAAGALPVERARQLAQRLEPLLKADGLVSDTCFPGLLGPGALSLAVIPVGHQAEYGFVVAASREAGFPDELQRALLSIGANQVAGALKEGQLSERGHAERARRESEERFAAVLTHAAIGLAVRTLEGRFVQVNPGLCAIAGYDEAELLATDFQSISHPEDVPQELDSIRRMLAGEIPGFVIEKRYLRRDGTVVWVQSSVTLVRDVEGRPKNVLALVQDVTDRKRAEDALRDSEGRYRMLVETAREMIITVDRDGRFTSFNAAFQALTGWSDAEWIGRPFTEILHPEDVTACLAVFEASLRGEVTPSVTHRLRTRGGEWLTFESTGTPQFRDGRVVAVLGVARDVTMRVRAEEELAQSRRRLQALFHNALDAILIVNDDDRYVDANPAAIELLGYSREELLSLTAMDLTPPGDRTALPDTLHAFAEHGRFSGDYRLLRKDGVVRDAEFRSVANILPGLHLAIVRDITERKRADEDLRRNRRLLEQAEEVAHVGCWEWDLASGSLVWSAETYRIFGVTPLKFAPSFEGFLERVHPEDRAFIRELNERAIRQGGSFAYEGRIVRPTGELRFMHARGQAERDAGGRVIRMMGIAQDITERKRDEELRTRLLKRLISIHEEERARISRELHDGAGQALTALLVGLRRVEDARSLTAARMAVARQRELVAQTIDELGRLARGLRPAVLDDLGLLAALRRYTADQAWLFGIDVVLEADGLGRKRLPRELETMLYRVVQEALANAARHARARRVRVALDRDREMVRLSVSDDGCGFEVERVLEAGAHLGLHSIRERAALAGGRAEIRSRPGHGTMVSVVVPVPRGAGGRRGAAGRSRAAKAAARQGRS